VRKELGKQAGRELADNIAASEAVMNDIRAAERASAPLSERLSTLFQERYQLDQEQQQAEAEKEASLLRRWIPWARTASEQAQANRERRRKHLEREMAQVLRQVGEENHRLGALYAKKDQLDAAFFRLQEALNREAE
jgi:2,3-bisphosphoglycerate-independent phosphoglycerate mutase